ncbi:TIGR04283 family arsenosugar biosynthesis glycosyltransferase [Sabulilitoribacter multivorans]|uniref:TIGR04283 family arsenosugar biosynthesis glycosyltransferase n=1 Tax=Flaviramulus multivorans TaxID=1304750 RepID=A0ABS9IKU2_9FLAO|nr:TIGR04283 family arsenosugar biosynthesis glycosyltransferase [Flaviramulus multivorans]MCF7561224.1 TIGR04283 family arsenosugar biosynthesis glycosyltransferase [Flaviramulus multivorans]
MSNKDVNHKISIIIPVLNEEAVIGKLLEYLLANASSENISEIIVVDGGSNDDTVNIVHAFSVVNNSKNIEVLHYVKAQNTSLKTDYGNAPNTTIKVINSEKGRAKQMNSGAKHATGDILYFLHADSFPPKYFDELIIGEVRKGNKAGCFRMQFDSNHWWLKLSGWFTQFSWRICRGGDQSQFITQSLFNDIGGFDENYIVYEDNILINELYARKQFVVINKNLKTSSRLYNKYGIWKLQFFYLVIYIKRWLGADANDLYRYYKKKIC